jgi:hypothetical protein
MWEYMEVIRLAAEPKCAGHLEKSIETIDNILGKPFSKTLKGLFGLAGLHRDEDFAALIAVHISCTPPILDGCLCYCCVVLDASRQVAS